MLLRIEPTTKNSYPQAGFLIKAKSLFQCLQELQLLDINPLAVEIYPIPDKLPNSLFGFLILDYSSNASALHHVSVHHIENLLFFPSYTSPQPVLVENDFAQTFKGVKHFLHPDLGTILLDKTLSLTDYLDPIESTSNLVKKPLSGIKIPDKVTGFSLELNQEDLIKEMLGGELSESVNLPFSMQKVLAGNEKEILKYLAFIDKHPELALQYAIPLDVLGTSRGRDFGRYFFKESFSEKVLNFISNIFSGAAENNASDRTSSQVESHDKKGKFIVMVMFFLAILFAIILVSRIADSGNVSSSNTGTVNTPIQTQTTENPQPKVVNPSEIFPQQTPVERETVIEQHTIESIPSANGSGFPWHFVLGFIFLFLLVMYLTRKKSINKNENWRAHIPKLNVTNNSNSQHKRTPSQVIPSQINWDDITKNPIGGGKQLPRSPHGISTLKSPIWGLIGLSAVLAYIFVPLIKFSPNSAWLIFSLLIVIYIFLRLFNPDYTFLKAEEDKIQTFDEKLFKAVFALLFLKFILVFRYLFIYSFGTFFISLVIFIVAGIGILLATALSYDKDDINTTNSHGRTALLGNDSFSRLQDKYRELAEMYIAQKQYQKAAYIYMKLLKNPFQAGVVLENGNLFALAASVFLNACSNKERAAEAYEKGTLYKQAINLHKELNNDEKVGDLYKQIGEINEANAYFDKVIDKHLNNTNYYAAAEVSQNKKEDIDSANSILLKGWNENREPLRCVYKYLDNTKNDSDKLKRITELNATLKDKNQEIAFIEVLKREYKGEENLMSKLRNFAYDIIVKNGKDNKFILASLKHFNPDNDRLNDDIYNYRS